MTYFDRRLASWLLSTSGAALLAGTQAIANPLGGTVVTGNVQISGTGTTSVIIDNNSARSIVDWDEFSIGTGETTRINQATSNSAIMNRVTGGNMSEIYGTLDSNGIVYLINENGIVVGPTGEISTGGFVASTLDTTNDEFLAGGDMIFRQGVEAGGGITVYGKIRSVTGGDIFLLSREIDIEAGADISSNGGYIGLGAGEEILLKPVDAGDGRITIRVGKGRIKNAGKIAGAVTELKAAGGNAYALAINNTGVIRATGVSKSGGRVMLTAGGKVSNSGKIRATKKVRIRSRKKIRNTGVVKVTGTPTSKPQIVFEAPEIEIAAGSLLDVSAALGGGSVFIGGGYQGGNTDSRGNAVDIIENATNVIVESGAVIKADATESGDGGEIVIWSDGTTVFEGDISAQALGLEGDGGQLEVSGKSRLAYRGIASAAAVNGNAGTLLLDPETIYVVTMLTAGAENEILDSTIEGLLEAGTSVTLSTTAPSTTPATLIVAGAGPSADGDVIFRNGSRIIWTDNDSGADTDALFTVHATRDINAFANVLIQHTEISAGTDFVDGDGGVRFLAGRNINIGAVAGALPGVAIGSEFGQNTFIAGDTDFDGAPDVAGAVQLVGGVAPNKFAQLGYQQDSLRGAGTGADLANATTRALNGAIVVRAGSSVTLIGGGDPTETSVSIGSFAQIGHGGLRTTNQDTAASITSVADIAGDISVTAGEVVTGNVNLSNQANSVVTSQAQIGHGSVITTGTHGAGALSHGNISGNITVTTINSDVNLNTSFTASADGVDDVALAQIGHGGHLVYTGADLAGTEATHGNIQGNITIVAGDPDGGGALPAVGSVNLGVNATAAAGDDRFILQSQIGHGGHIQMIYDGSAVGLNDSELEAVHGRIASFEVLNTGAVMNTNISVRAGEYNILAQETVENSGGSTGLVVDNLQHSQIGHGMETVAARSGGNFGSVVSVDGTAVIAGTGDAAIDGLTLAAFLALGNAGMNALLNNDGDPLTEDLGERTAIEAVITLATTTSLGIGVVPVVASLGSLNVTVTEGDIAGNITIIDDEAATTGGITLNSTITGTLTATNFDAMISRIGHGSQSYLNSNDGDVGAGDLFGDFADGHDGGDITVTQAHILGARISVSTSGVEGDDDDITLITSLVGGLAPVEDNTTVAQIGHSGDIFAHTGNGGAGDHNNGFLNVEAGASGNGGDITINKGTVWDGFEEFALSTGGTASYGQNDLGDGNVEISVFSSNQIIIDSDTLAGLSPTNRNNAESSIGSGHKIRLATGDGGSDTEAASGGRGGDVTVTQRFDTRENGGTNHDIARGLRGNIDLTATHTSTGAFALDITSDDTAALAPTNNNMAVSTAGHGDVIEVVTGNGGDGGDANALIGVNMSANVPPESFGGRGGHVIVSLGDEVLAHSMLIESDITANITGAVQIQSMATNALSPSVRNIVESVLGHSQRIFGHAGDGGDGGTADFLSNGFDASGGVFANALEQDAFLVTSSGGGAVRGGNGGDVSIGFGDIVDRQGNATTGFDNNGEADVMLIVTGDNTTDISTTVRAQTNHALGESVGNDLFAGIGHHTRLYGEGGVGGDGGTTLTEFGEDDFNLPDVQPDASGGRGGDVRVVAGNIQGDVIVDVPRQLLVDSVAGHGTFTKVYANVGHTTDLVAVSQNGGDGGDLDEDLGGDGGIDPQNSGKTIILIDGNDDDRFDLTGVNDSNDTTNEDGVRIVGVADNGDTDGVADMDDIRTSLGGDPNVAGNVLFFDEEADPEFIRNAADNAWIPNNAANIAERNNGANLAMFERTVGEYGVDVGETDMFVDLDPSPMAISVDLVDFDRDGRIDIVDIDQDGIYDQIDGRRSFTDVAEGDPFNGIGILDYRAVTGQAYDQRHLEGGWTLQNRYSQGGKGQNTTWSTLSANSGDGNLASSDILAVRDHTDIISEDGRALVGDFSTSNGGRGGDAATKVGYTVGDVEIDTGSDNGTATNVDSLIVRSTLTDLIVATGGPRDVSVARIGHGAFQFSDTGISYSKRAAGRVETARFINNDFKAIQGHNFADGGGAGYYAINASGGRGGDASVVQGVNRDNTIDATARIETDHLVGDIYINVTDDEQPADLVAGRANPNDARRVTIEATATLDAGTGLSQAQIGHGAEAAAAAGAWTGLNGPLIDVTEGHFGGDGASDGSTGGADTTSQTEIADGGRGGDAVLTQHYIKGDIFLQAGEDDGPGSNSDISLQILATKGAIVPSGPNDIVLAQLGHGRLAQVTGGSGGQGDDGQWRGNGGRGGDATLTQNEIRDGFISVDLVDAADGFYGNGVLIESKVQESSNHIVRAQAGHGDLAMAEAGFGGFATFADGTHSDVIEQRNQTANGGRGGDALINQAGYNHDILFDIGPNLDGGDALQVLSHVDTTDVGTDNHVLAAIGHGGYGEAISNAGGDGGPRDGDDTISSSNDPNQRDGIDEANGIGLGTDRNGGRGGDATVNLGVGGTGSLVFGRENFDFGRNDNTGADIVITMNDDFLNNNASFDGVLIEARTGEGANLDDVLHTTTAIAGHTSFAKADASAATGGFGIQTSLSALISEGDGGDGGDGLATTGFIDGGITIENTSSGAFNNSGIATDTDIRIRAIDQLPSDGANHIAEARAGHLTAVEALGGDGGDAAREDGPNPSFPAVITARGGDGGDATTFQGQLSGAINVRAENTVLIEAVDGQSSAEALIAGVGHRMEARAVALDGGFGGTVIPVNQNLYFIYEALREYATRRQAGDNHANATAALSEFERKLIEPIISDYFEDKEIRHFLEKMTQVPQTTGMGGSFGGNDRDDNFVGGTNFTIPALTKEEEDTLQFLMAAAGDGGHATITQGSTEGLNQTYSVSGDIIVQGLGRNLLDPTRGVRILATEGGSGGAFEEAHVGHKAVILLAYAGHGQDIAAYDDAMGGDGGNVDLTQYSFGGVIAVSSNHKINVEATDGSSGAGTQRALVGHRLAIGQDRDAFRLPEVVRAGDGGSETSNLADGYNGNGGNVRIRQFGAITGVTNGGTVDARLDISFLAGVSSDDDVSIRLLASSTGSGSQEAELHIGHDMVIDSVKAGDAGQQHADHAPVGLDEGIREGNGGDIRINQGDIGADIDFTARDAFDADAITGLAAANDAHLIIGHERTIGEISDTHNDTDGRDGTIVAGFGGDSVIEDYNDTATIDSWNGFGTVTGNTTDVEDADSGAIYITHGVLTDSQRADEDGNAATPNDGVITITSRNESVTIDSATGLGNARARIEIGLSQHVHAQTLEASLEVDGPPHVRTAGDGGDIRITRGAIGDVDGDDTAGDILIQALDRIGTGVGGVGGADHAVIVHSKTGLSGIAEVLIGHETEFGDENTGSGNDLLGINEIANKGTAISTSTGTSGASNQSSGFGEAKFAQLLADLTDFTDNLDDPDSDGATGQPDATLRDANDALQDIENVVAVIAMANKNADRYNAADRTSLDNALNNPILGASAALAAANQAMADLASGANNETQTINVIRIAAQNAVAALTLADVTVTAAEDSNLNSLMASNQIADHADAGSIIYTATNALSDLNGTRSLGGTNVEGRVQGDITLRSGRDTDNDNIPDTFTSGLVQVTAATGLAIHAQSEIGHRRTMWNVTGQGGGDSDGGPEEGGVAGDGGSIMIGDLITGLTIGDVAQVNPVTGNRTAGNVLLQADEVVVRSETGLGTSSEAHLGHDVEVTNFADQSDIENLLGNGGDIYSAQTVDGNVTIEANHLGSTLTSVESDGAGGFNPITLGVSEDSILGANSGLGIAKTHLGHQVDADNDSRSDETTGGTGGDEANRAGEIITAQNTRGIVSVSLDLDGDGNPNDLTFQTLGAGTGFTRLGHEAAQDAFSGDPTDDGAQVVADQNTGGNINIFNVEDLLIESLGAGDNDVHLGHDASNIAQSGDVDGGTGDEYGELVDADQTITGALNFFGSIAGNNLRSFVARTLGATVGEVHVGHEGTLSGLSGDDTDHPSDGVANDGGTASSTSSGFHDVDTDQLIQAEITVRAGEILIEAGAGGGDREKEAGVQLGHEAFIIADTDGGRPDSTVHSRSYINPAAAIGDNDDIVLIASTTGIPADDDASDDTLGATASTHLADGINGDITIRDLALASEAQVGHRSHSNMSHGVGNQPTGTFDTLQAIGGEIDGTTDGLIGLEATGLGSGLLVANTAASTITISAERDLNVLDEIGGIAQIGHFITEESAPLSSSGAVQTPSQIRQVVGSDIVIGDGPSLDDGIGGVGNNLVMVSTGGRSEIGHRSPASNEWQVSGMLVAVTPQILDGDITIEVGSDAGGAINGAAPGDTLAGGDDDALLDGSAGGVLRIGHNHTSDSETSGNQVQVSAGDIWLRVDSDLHVLGGGGDTGIGHEHYDHADVAIDPNNTIAGVGSRRNRIFGLTTIGAGQNSPAEDSSLLANVMLFDGTAGAVGINSGYGGKGDADVDGELRFFLPAQEGLTIIAAVQFNDSVSNADPVTPRTADASNVFAGTTGMDHEHSFTTMSETADYKDALIGDGNFTFYFESEGSPEFDYIEPNIEILNFNTGFSVTYNDQQSGGTVNSRIVDGNQVAGTSSFEIQCEEQGLSPEECENPVEGHTGQQRSASSSVGHAGVGGGNQSGLTDPLDNPLNQDGADGFFSSAGYVQQFNLRAPVTSVIEQPIYVNSQKVKYARTHVSTATAAYAPVTTINHADRVDATTVDNTYGQYMTGADLAEWRIKQKYGDVMAQQTSYRLFEKQG